VPERCSSRRHPVRYHRLGRTNLVGADGSGGVVLARRLCAGDLRGDVEYYARAAGWATQPKSEDQSGRRSIEMCAQIGVNILPWVGSPPEKVGNRDQVTRRNITIRALRLQKVLTWSLGVHECRPGHFGIRGYTDVEAGVGRRGLGMRALMLTAVVALAGCTNSNGVHLEPSPSTSSTARPTSVSPSPDPAATIDPRARAAVHAYESLSTAFNTAVRKPVRQGTPFPPGADIEKWSFDPFRMQSKLSIWNLAAEGIKYRGTPATAHIQVEKIDLKASPWPTVTLSNCPTGGNWHGYNARTKAQVPEATPSVPPPYQETITVIFFQKHWGVRTLTIDTSRTCAV